MQKQAVLLSGGVDSSVALAQVCKERDEHGKTHITAFYLKIWLEDEVSFLGNCPWEEDLSYARAVCEKLGVELRVVPLQKEYHERVVSYVLSEIKEGRTPSPDVMCNSLIKLGAFIDYLDAQGEVYDWIITGHYARSYRMGDIKNMGVMPVHLAKSRDLVKDQTYFLANLTQAQLSRLMFAIGAMTKEEVREHARQLGLPTKDRKDSQGICFLGKISYPKFIEHYLGKKEGFIVEEETGKVLGSHDGYWFYTIGQRKGIGLSGGPWYVVRKDIARNIVYISRNYFDDDKKRNSFVMRKMNWILGKRPEETQLDVKLRHGPQVNQATLSWREDGSVRVVLAQRDQGIAPGQFAVFYDGDECLGCGVIELDDQNLADYTPS